MTAAVRVAGLRESDVFMNRVQRRRGVSGPRIADGADPHMFGEDDPAPSYRSRRLPPGNPDYYRRPLG
jgi:hypothetical protein